MSLVAMVGLFTAWDRVVGASLGMLMGRVGPLMGEIVPSSSSLSVYGGGSKGRGVVFFLKWGGFFPNFSCYSGGIESFSIGIFSLSRALLEGGSSL